MLLYTGYTCGERPGSRALWASNMRYHHCSCTAAVLYTSCVISVSYILYVLFYNFDLEKMHCSISNGIQCMREQM